MSEWYSYKKSPKKVGQYEVLLGKRNTIGILYLSVLDLRWDGNNWNAPENHIVMKWRRK